MQYERFESWSDVVSYAKQHGHVYYQAPLDATPVRVEATLPKRKPRNSTVPGDGWKGVIKLTPHAALEADPFWVFSDHLARMRRPVSGDSLSVKSSEPGQTVDAGDVVITTTLHRLG